MWAVRVQVKAMTPQEVARMWAEYMSALMKQLTVAQSSAGSPEAAGRAENRISELLQEVRSQSNPQSCPPQTLNGTAVTVYPCCRCWCC